MKNYKIKFTGMDQKPRSIIILSTKSSGSSLLQYLIASAPDIKMVGKTQHAENETLYWTKAASILNLPQIKMLKSEVPIETSRAESELRRFLLENTQNGFDHLHGKELVFKGWEELCKSHTPILLEKSPHHLLQWGCIQLIYECMQTIRSTDFKIIGLIRNPLDVLYSYWDRWGVGPDKKEHELIIEAENLIKAKDLFGDQFLMVRYEDLVKNAGQIEKIFTFLNIVFPEGLMTKKGQPHTKSIQKWRGDLSFAHSLQAKTVLLYQEMGYQAGELICDNKKSMPKYMAKYISHWVKHLKGNIRKTLK